MTLTSGYFEFLDNTTLDADELNGYLQQGVLIFDDASDRETQLSSVLREGMVAYTKDDDTIRVFDGDGWLATDNPLITTPKTGASSVSLDRYAYWTFTGSGSLTVVRGGLVDVLCVGGGGAGGGAGVNGPVTADGGGGGGGGAVVEATSVYLAPGTYSIIIGAGGTSIASFSYNGNASLLGSGLVVAPGGGGGAGLQGSGTYNAKGFPGGSGGGGGSAGTVTGGSAFATFGNAGGNGRSSATKAGGGGGGAGSAGSNAASAAGGDGGDGVIKNYPPAAVASIYYGGGGGGGVGSGGTAGNGGDGGGGDGGVEAAGTAGTVNTGGGGGGRGRTSSGFLSGANGGSGIVIVRMKYL